MWVTTSDADLVDVRGAWIRKSTGAGGHTIVARFPVGPGDGMSGWSGVTLYAHRSERARDEVYINMRQALQDGESSFNTIEAHRNATR